MCNERFIPRNDLKKEQGRKKEYYFAHYQDTCGGSVESYFHWVAKEIIAKASDIILPNGNYSYDSVLLECTTLHPSIRPDAVLSNEIIVEVGYRNPKAGKHIAMFAQLNLTAIEIDLSALVTYSSLETIRHAVLRKTANKTYLHLKENRSEVAGQSTSNGENTFLVIVGLIFGFLGLRALRNSTLRSCGRTLGTKRSRKHGSAQILNSRF